jgi:hypothetical protein
MNANGRCATGFYKALGIQIGHFPPSARLCTDERLLQLLLAVEVMGDHSPSRPRPLGDTNSRGLPVADSAIASMAAVMICTRRKCQDDEGITEQLVASKVPCCPGRHACPLAGLGAHESGSAPIVRTKAKAADLHVEGWSEASSIGSCRSC